MTQSKNTDTLSPQLHFSGPQDDAHLNAWRELRRRMSGGLDDGKYVLPHMNLLNELAFGNQPLHVTIAAIPGGSDGYTRAKQSVESLMADLSFLQLEDKRYRPLYRSLVAGLVGKWTAYRDGDGQLDGDSPDRLANLLATREGAFLCGALRMSQDGTLTIKIDYVGQQLGVVPASPGHDKIVEKAEQLLSRALLTYELSGGGHFNTFVIGALDRFLLLGVTKSTKSDKDPVLTAREVIPEFVPSRTASPLDTILEDEDRHLRLTKLHSVLRNLPENDRKLAQDLFGLDGNSKRGQNAIAQELGVRKQAVSLQRKRLLKELREAMGDEEIER